MISTKGILLAHCSLLASLPVMAGVIPPSTGPFTLSFSSYVTEISDPGTGYSATVDVQSRLTVGVLLGEPVYTCVASWELLSIKAGDDAFNVGLTGSAAGTFSAERVPSSVLSDVAFYDVELSFPLVPALGLRDDGVLLCDAGIMKTAGSGQPSFNVPSSPAWDELIWGEFGTASYLGTVDAKNRYVAMLEAYAHEASRSESGKGSVAAGGGSAWRSKVRSGSLNLWAVRNWLDGLAREEALSSQRQAALEQREPQLISHGGQISDDAFDAFMTAVYRKEEAKQTLAEIDRRRDSAPDRTGLDRAAMIADLASESCVGRDNLAGVGGGWDAGASMHAMIAQCPEAHHSPAPASFGLKLTATPRD